MQARSKVNLTGVVALVLGLFAFMANTLFCGGILWRSSPNGSCAKREEDLNLRLSCCEREFPNKSLFSLDSVSISGLDSCLPAQPHMNEPEQVHHPCTGIECQ